MSPAHASAPRLSPLNHMLDLITQCCACSVGTPSNTGRPISRAMLSRAHVQRWAVLTSNMYHVRPSLKPQSAQTSFHPSPFPCLAQDSTSACSRLFARLWQGISPRDFTRRRPTWTRWIRRSTLSLFGSALVCGRTFWLALLWSLVSCSCGLDLAVHANIFSGCFKGLRCSNVSPHAQVCSCYAS